MRKSCANETNNAGKSKTHENRRKPKTRTASAVKVSRRRRVPHPRPARGQAVLDPQQVQHACNRMVDHLLDGGRPVVKARQWWKDDAAHLGDGGHVAQM